jgi:hypothetical protein
LRKEDAKRQKPPRTRIPSGGTDSKVGTSHRREVLSKFFAGLDLNYTGVVIGSKRLRRLWWQVRRTNIKDENFSAPFCRKYESFSDFSESPIVPSGGTHLAKLPNIIFVSLKGE